MSSAGGGASRSPSSYVSIYTLWLDARSQHSVAFLSTDPFVIYLLSFLEESTFSGVCGNKMQVLRLRSRKLKQKKKPTATLHLSQI